jgi:hypothetical protein
MTAYPLKQTVVTVTGVLEADRVLSATKQSRSNKFLSSLRTSSGLSNNNKRGFSTNSAQNRDTKTASKTLKTILELVQEHFNKPETIDQRRKEHFLEVEMPNVQPLTAGEEEMIAGNVALIKSTKGAKRYGSLKDDVDKFIYVEEETGKVFGISKCIVDTRAAEILVDIFAIRTCEAAKLHEEKNGELPRMLWEGIDGTRSQQYSVFKRLPPPLQPRLFEAWRCWQRVVDKETGIVSFIFAFVPLSQYKGTSRSIPFSGNFKVGTSTGIYIITEIAPQVCSIFRLQVRFCLGVGAT